MHSLIRSQEIFNPVENPQRVTLVGAGAVGSRVFASLVELGIQNITVYDPDVTEEHNLGSQLFNHADIGDLKVNGLLDWANRKLGHSPPASMKFHPDYVVPSTKLVGTVFLMVDSLAERKKLFEACMVDNLDCPLVIDTRMAATHGNVIACSPHEHATQYLATLGSDEDAEVSACGSPFSVAPTAAIIANLAVWKYIQFRTNPAALEHVTDIYLKPFILSSRNFT